MSKTVILTGAAGFIGRHIARVLAANGWDVVGVDMAPAENAHAMSLARYAQMRLPDARFEKLVAAARPLACVHCAGSASVARSFEDPGVDFRSGTVLTFEVLDALRRHAPACHFVFLSSAAVYGEPVALPVNEAQQVRPISPYGFHKRQSELLCEEFSSVYGLRASYLRIFSAYGPGLRRQVIWDLCHQMLTQGTLRVHGTGAESRDFVHVSDVARAVQVVLEGAPSSGGAVNVASGREVTIRELAEKLATALGHDGLPEFDGSVPTGNPLNWRADISKLQELGFSPTLKLDEGIRAVASWCRSEISAL